MDEISGEGNDIDFGARIYDCRLGRWMSLDPLMIKYPSFSPYNYVLNNPLIFRDGDGKVVIGSDGKAVTYEKIQGKIVWSSNATEDIMKVGNAMLTTEFGENAFNQWQDAKTSVKIKIDHIHKPSDRTADTDFGDGELNEDGQYKAITVTFYERSIKKAIKSKSKDRWRGASFEEALGAIGTHEVYHNDAEQVKLDAEVPDELSQNTVKNKPINAEINFRQQYHDTHLTDHADWMSGYRKRGYVGLIKKIACYNPEQPHKPDLNPSNNSSPANIDAGNGTCDKKEIYDKKE